MLSDLSSIDDSNDPPSYVSSHAQRKWAVARVPSSSRYTAVAHVPQVMLLPHPSDLPQVAALFLLPALVVRTGKANTMKVRIMAMLALLFEVGEAGEKLCTFLL